MYSLLVVIFLFCVPVVA